MNFNVAKNIEAVDQLVVWAVTKVIEKRDASLVVVTFPHGSTSETEKSLIPKK